METEQMLVSKDQIASTKSLSVRDIGELAATGRLNLKPSFQRNLVWSKEAKSYLIDTMIRGLPVPEIIAYGSPETVLSIIDGQQRLSTILDCAKGPALEYGRACAFRGTHLKERKAMVEVLLPIIKKTLHA
jgi:hypothetical protein